MTATMLLILRTPAENTRGATYVASLLQTLHMLRLSKRGIDLLIRTSRGQSELAIDCPEQLRQFFAVQLQDAYPGTVIEIERQPEPPAGETWSIELRVSPDVFSIRTTEDFRDSAGREFPDPIAGLLSAIHTGRSGRINCTVRLRIRPASRFRVQQAEQIRAHAGRRFPFAFLRRWYLRSATDPRWFSQILACILLLLSRSPKQHRENDAETALEPLFECRLVVEATAPSNAAHIAKNKLHEIAAAYGQFSSEETTFVAGRPKRGLASRKRWGFLLSPMEIASLWHPPTASVRSVSRVHISEFRELEPPVWLPSSNTEPDVTTLGRVQYRNQRDRFGIRCDDLRRHLLVIGKSGCGKSTFLLNIVSQQLQENRGVILIDPHGQLAEEVLEFIPRRRTNDVILFDAGDRAFPVGFNPLIGPPGSDPTLIADGVLTAFKKVFGFDAGSAPRLLHIFRNCLLSLIGQPDASLTAIQRLLTDAGYRKSVIPQVRNPAVREFWLAEFGRWNDRDRTQYIASLQNKLGAFTTNERLQRIFAPGRKGIQLRTILDRGQVLICNLSKGTVGHDASTLLGSLLLSSLQTAAMSRADLPEQQRRDATVVVDEFHSFLSEGNSTMADALAESRKYRTSYVLSTQMLEQLDPATLAGVLGNCGSTLCMTVGPRDAEVLCELLAHGLTPQDLMQIPKYHGYLRLLIDGAPKTFSMTTLTPPRIRPGNPAVIRRVSRERYGAVAQIEQKQLVGV